MEPLLSPHQPCCFCDCLRVSQPRAQGKGAPLNDREARSLSLSPRLLKHTRSISPTRRHRNGPLLVTAGRRLLRPAPGTPTPQDGAGPGRWGARPSDGNLPPARVTGLRRPQSRDPTFPSRAHSRWPETHSNAPVGPAPSGSRPAEGGRWADETDTPTGGRGRHPTSQLLRVCCCHWMVRAEFPPAEFTPGHSADDSSYERQGLMGEKSQRVSSGPQNQRAAESDKLRGQAPRRAREACNPITGSGSWGLFPG